MKKTMRQELIKEVFLISCMALCLGVLPAVAATGNTWSGSGPFATGEGNRVINALAVSPDGRTIYAGTGSGTVFQNVIPAYTVTPSAGAGGTISPNTPQTVNYGETASFTVTPNTGYGISSVTGCGGTLSGNTYTTGPITGACTVSASFAENLAITQKITVTKHAPSTAANGESFEVTATASSGLPVAITVKGSCSGSGAGTATITMTDGTGGCTVHYNQAGDDVYNAAPEVTETTGISYPSHAVAVPTMDGWGMAIFLLLAGLGSVVYLRRRKVKAQ